MMDKDTNKKIRANETGYLFAQISHVVRSSQVQSHVLSPELRPSCPADRPQGHDFPSLPLSSHSFCYSSLNPFPSLSPGRWKNKEKLNEKTRAQETSQMHP